MFKIAVYKEFRSKRRRVRIDYSFEITIGNICALYGSSGLGKSTLLRIIAGLDSPERGEIVHGDCVLYSNTRKINLPVNKRNVGFVFQDYNLFPNMTVGRNLQYASKGGKIPSTVLELLVTLHLKPLMDSYPDELSGGQRQRVAVLRALCQEPQILLLDEPFSAMDDGSILELIREITLVRDRLNATILVVSHRKDVIFKMADEVVHLHEDGTVLSGKPEDVLTRDF